LEKDNQKSLSFNFEKPKSGTLLETSTIFLENEDPLSLKSDASFKDDIARTISFDSLN
jgi:hypothetical protein